MISTIIISYFARFATYLFIHLDKKRWLLALFLLDLFYAFHFLGDKVGHNIPLASNLATAEALLLALDRGDLDWRNNLR